MSKGLSRRALRDVETDPDLSEQGIPDKRAEDMKALTVIESDVLETLKEVFDGTGLLGDQRKVKLLLKLRADVSVAWGQTRDAFLEIGRALNDVDRQLDPAERERFKAGFRRLFPFSDTVASQFRAIARAVDSGHVPKDAVPGSYGAAYQLALLSPGELVIARERGLVRPDVGREILIAFRREVKAGAAAPPVPGLDPATLRREMAKLGTQRQRALADLVRVRRRMQQIRALLAVEAGDAED
jgi:hypothetical protein